MTTEAGDSPWPVARNKFMDTIDQNIYRNQWKSDKFWKVTK